MLDAGNGGKKASMTGEKCVGRELEVHIGVREGTVRGVITQSTELEF